MAKELQKFALGGRPPAWLVRLDEIAERVKAGSESFGRREIEALFRVGKRQALLILRRANCSETSEGLRISQLELLRFLSTHFEDRDRVRARLHRIAEATKGVCFVSPETSKRGSNRGACATSLGSIPGIQAERGRLTIHYDTPVQLCEALVALAVYLGEHPEEL